MTESVLPRMEQLSCEVRSKRYVNYDAQEAMETYVSDQNLRASHQCALGRTNEKLTTKTSVAIALARLHLRKVGPAPSR